MSTDSTFFDATSAARVALRSASAPNLAQRRFNAICAIGPGFLRGGFQPAHARELMQAVELAMAAWPLQAASRAFSGLSRTAYFKPSQGPFNTETIEPRTGQALLAHIGKQRAMRRNDASKRGKQTRLEREAGLHWLAQCGARFGDVIEVSTRQYKTLLLVTDCDVEIGDVGATRGIPYAVVSGFFGKGPAKPRLACDPLVPPRLVARNDELDFVDLLWDAVSCGWQDATFRIEDECFFEDLRYGWRPTEEDLFDAELNRYTCDSQSWLSVRDEPPPVCPCLGSPAAAKLPPTPNQRRDKASRECRRPCIARTDLSR